MNIVIVGVGALGSNLVPLLRNLKASIKVCDFDKVEMRNVQSQFHAKSSVGKLKVTGLAQSLDFLYGMKVQANPNKLVEANAREILGTRSSTGLVVDCLDNGVSRRVIQAYVRANDMPCLHGAVDANGTFGRVAWDDSFVVHDEDAVGTPTCEDGEHLPFLSITASYLAHAVKLFVQKGECVAYYVSPRGTVLV